MKKKARRLLVSCFLFLASCSTNDSSQATGAEPRAPVSAVTAPKLSAIVRASEALASTLCKRIKECGGQWSDGNCAGDMAKDISSLLSSAANRPNGEALEKCGKAIQYYHCPLVLKNKFPDECEAIQ